MPLNKYDDMLQKAGEGKNPNPYDSLLSEESDLQKSALKSSMFVAADKEPDREAEVLNISKRLKVPAALVDRNLDDFRKTEVKQRDYDSLIQETPGLSRFLERPENAAIGKDDLDNLSRIDKGVRIVGPKKEKDSYFNLPGELYRAGRTGWNNLGASTFHLAAAYGLMSPDEAATYVAESNQRAASIREQMPDYAKEFNSVMAREGGDIDKSFQRFTGSFSELREGQILKAVKDFWGGGAMTVAEAIDMVAAAAVRPRGLLYSTSENLINSAPSLALGFVGAKTLAPVGGAIGTAVGAPTGPGAIATGGAGTAIGGGVGFVGGAFVGSVPVEIGAWINEELGRRGVDVTDPESIRRAYADPKLMSDVRAQAERKGLTTAAVDALFNAFAGKFVAGKNVTKATGLSLGKRTLQGAKNAGRAALDIGVQSAGETASEFAGQVAAQEGDLSKINLGEAVQEGITSMGQSVGETAIGASIRSKLPKKTSDAAEAVVNDTNKALKAQNDVQALNEVGDAVKESKLAKRVPEKVQELVDTATGGEGASKVYFQTDEWDSYWTAQGKSPARAAEQIMGDGGRAYHEAKEIGSPLSIPLGQYVARVAPTEDFNNLLGVTRTQPDGMTLAEANQFLQSLPATMQELAQEAAATEQEKAADQSAAQIRSEIQRQLVETGKSKSDADKTAQLYESFFRTMGQRYGIDPMQLFQQYGLKIRSQDGVSAALDENVLNQNKSKLSENSKKLAEEGFDFFESPDPVFDEDGNEIDGAGVGEPGYQFTVYAQDNTGNDIGQASFIVDENGDLVPNDFDGDKEAVTVDASFRRKGIATELYRLASEHVGKPVSNKNWQTDSGKAFREALREIDDNIFLQDDESTIRGQLRFGKDRQFNIDLFKAENYSTVLHESGHFFLEVLADVAGSEQATDQIKDDFKTILDWFGVESRDQIETKHHEQFAKGFETYLMEGKAPSQKLRRAFATFKVWLTNVYRRIRSLVPMTQEVRGVFDRMLATEDEIAAAELEQGQDPLFLEPGAFGMSDAQAARYIEAREEARRVAEETLANKLMAEVRRAESKKYKEDRKEVRAEVEARVNNQNIYKAISILGKGKMPDGSPVPDGMQSLKLDKQAIVNQYGKEFLQKLPRPYVYTVSDGVHPDVAASLLGFEGGDALLTQMANAPDRVQAIEAETNQRMTELYPSLLTDDAIEVEAMKAVHNDHRARLLRMELEHLASNNMPALKDVIRRVARRVPTEKAVRAQAEAIISNKTIEESRPYLFQRAEVRYANQAAELLTRGDIDGAFDAKRKELLNHELYRAAVAAEDDFKKAVKQFKKIAKSDEKISKNRDLDLVNAARAVLAQHGLGRTEKLPAEYLSQMKQYAPDTYETVTALIDGISESPIPYKQMTYGQFVNLKESVLALWDLAKTEKSIEVDGKLIDRDIAIAELEQGLSDLDVKANKAGYEKAATNWEKTKMGLLGAKAALRRVESWVDALDKGNTLGAFRKYIFTPIAESVARYRIDKKTYVQRYLDIVSPLKGQFKKQDIKSDELQYTFSGKAELLGAMLHIGNASNKQKLLRGRGWGDFDINGNLDTSRWDAFINRMIEEKVLAKEDFDFLQNVWDMLEELKPMAQKAHKKMYGYYFNEITAEEVITPFGTYRGGYVPAVADPMIAQDARIRNEKEVLEKFNNSFMFPTSGRGFTKSRVEQYTAPLMMDLRFVGSHIDKVLRFVHIEPHIKDVSRIVMNKDFRSTLDAFDPAAASDMLVPWLQRSAQQRIYQPSQGLGGRFLDTMAREVRTRTGLQIMVGNVVNTIQQFTGLSIAAVKVKPKHLRNAMWDYVHRPRKLADEIAEKSEFMRTRNATQAIEIQQTIDELLLDPSKYEQAKSFARKHGYFMQQGTQNVVDIVTWLGAYEQAVETGVSELEAVRAADAAVRLTQGSFNPEDISRFETGSPFVRMFTMFYSYFNMQANLLGSEAFIIQAQRMGLKKGAGRGFYVYVMGFMIPAVLSEMIVRAGSGDLDEDDDDQYLDDFLQTFFMGQIRTATAMFPVAGQVAQGGINSLNDNWYDDRISVSPVIGSVESAVRAPKSVYDSIAKGKNRKKAIRDTLTAVGLLTGVPVAPLARPLGYLSDVEEGKIRPSGPIDFTRGLITGRGERKK